ncbi:hypothetical protein FQA39_LY17924 [Lamprigera yunnana]|nr:hypothetical protein FQA39_LY17924 [Lamprigera yunnana]
MKFYAKGKNGLLQYDPLCRLQKRIFSAIGVNEHDEDKPMEIKQVFVLNANNYENMRKEFLNTIRIPTFNSFYRRSRSKSGSYHRSNKSRHSKGYHHHHSRSRDQQRLKRSRSKDYIKEYISRKSRSSSSTSSSSTSTSSSNTVKGNVKIFKNTENRSDVLKNENNQNFNMPDIDSDVLEKINSDSFEQKSFLSKNKKLPNTIVIDLKKQTIKVPEIEPVEPDSIFHHNLFLSEEARTEKWVKELYIYRQKALQQGIKNA